VKKLTNKGLTPRKLLNTTLKDLDDLKAIKVVALNVKHLTSLMDYVVVATGNSSRHVRAIANHICQKMKERHISFPTVEGDDNDEWILIDLGDVIVHIMQAKAREFYNIEKLWATKELMPKSRTKPPSIVA
jgi:ribosome-associated protein